MSKIEPFRTVPNRSKSPHTMSIVELVDYLGRDVVVQACQAVCIPESLYFRAINGDIAAAWEIGRTNGLKAVKEILQANGFIKGGGRISGTLGFADRHRLLDAMEARPDDFATLDSALERVLTGKPVAVATLQKIKDLLL